MQIVIDIPEDEYRNILLTGKVSFCVVNAIEAGIPLPKGHGRLIDKDKIIGNIYGVRSITAVLDAPTIIEADKESEAQT